MAVKDDPATRIKAAVAKQAMESGLRKAHHFCTDLIHAHKLHGVAAFYFEAEGEARFTVGCFDSRGRDILHEWATHLAERVPSEISNLRGAVVLAIRNDGVIDIATWGSDRAACDAIAAWRDNIWDFVTVAPFTTWFGYGNSGMPKPMSAADLATLTENQQRYVQERTHPAYR